MKQLTLPCVSLTALPPPSSHRPQPDLLVVSREYRDDGLDRSGIVAEAICFACGWQPFSRVAQQRHTVETVRKTAAQPCYVVICDSEGDYMRAALEGIEKRCGGSADSDDDWCYVLPLAESEPLEPGGRVRSIELAAYELGGWLIEKARRTEGVAAMEEKFGRGEATAAADNDEIEHATDANATRYGAPHA